MVQRAAVYYVTIHAHNLRRNNVSTSVDGRWGKKHHWITAVLTSGELVAALGVIDSYSTSPPPIPSIATDNLAQVRCPAKPPDI